MIGFVAGIFSLVAAAATVVWGFTLVRFFSRAEPVWTRNDSAGIVMMLALIPVALGIGPSWWIVIMGVAGMLSAATAQTLLVAGRRTNRHVLRWILGSGAVVGTWYRLVGLLSRESVVRGGLELLAIASGLGYLGVCIGFWRGNRRNPLAIAGAALLLMASTWFLAWLWWWIVTGHIGFGTTT